MSLLVSIDKPVVHKMVCTSRDNLSQKKPNMISSDYTTIKWAVLAADLKWVHHDMERIVAI